MDEKSGQGTKDQLTKRVANALSVPVVSRLCCNQVPGRGNDHPVGVRTVRGEPPYRVHAADGDEAVNPLVFRRRGVSEPRRNLSYLITTVVCIQVAGRSDYGNVQLLKLFEYFGCCNVQGQIIALAILTRGVAAGIRGGGRRTVGDGASYRGSGESGVG